jgi:hypothetical protein
MKSCVILAILLVAFASCKQEENPQPTSTWTIGTDSFATNRAELHSGNKGQNFSLSIYADGSHFAYSNNVAGGLPGDGIKTFDLTGRNNNPDYLDIGFSKGDGGYRPFDSTSYMVSSRADKIATMEMSPTRFRNAFPPYDTQWIKATIRVREQY